MQDFSAAQDGLGLETSRETDDFWTCRVTRVRFSRRQGDRQAWPGTPGRENERMFRTVKLGMLVLACASFIGCGSESATPEQAAATAAPQTNSNAKESVQLFLQAVKDGDDKTAETMLTPLAREKTAEFDIAVAPPGSQTATFKVLDLELIGDDAAHVASQWTDYDQDGQPHTDDLVWMVRLEPEGWRIAGMAARLFPEEPPLFLNFEDPEDMIRKQELAAEEIRQRAMAGETQRQAAQPASTQQQETLRQ